MSGWLKQSTAATVKLGPFVDSTDGVTAETALTISQADIRLSKNGGDIAQTNNATGGTHDELGYYDIPLDTTDTNTLGRLKVAVSESGALPVWDDFMVLPANVWDSLFGADKLQVHADEITAGLITAAAIGTGAIDADAIAADAITAAKIADGAIDAATFAAGAINAAAIASDAITDAKVASDVTISSVTGAVGSVAGNVGGNVVGSVGSVTAGVTLAASAVQAIWDALTSALTPAGSIGKLLVDNVNATISSRATPAQVNTEADTALLDVGLTSTVTGRIDATITSRLATSGYTAPPSVASILAGVIEGSLTVKDSLLLMLSVMTGKSSGGGTNTVNYRDTGDTKNRVVATVDTDGNRTAVTRDVTD